MTRYECWGINKRTLQRCLRPARRLFTFLGQHPKEPYFPLCAAHARSGWAKACGFYEVT